MIFISVALVLISSSNYAFSSPKDEAWLAVMSKDAVSFKGPLILRFNGRYSYSADFMKKANGEPYTLHLEMQGNWKTDNGIFSLTATHRAVSLNEAKTSPSLISKIRRSDLLTKLNQLQNDSNEWDHFSIREKGAGYVLIAKDGFTIDLVERINISENPSKESAENNSAIVPSLFNGVWYSDVWLQGTIESGGVNTVLNGGIGDLMRMTRVAEKNITQYGEKVIYLVQRPSDWTFNVASMTNLGDSYYLNYKLPSSVYDGTCLNFFISYKNQDGYIKKEHYQLTVREEGWLSGNIIVEDYYNGSLEIVYKGYINLFDSRDKLYEFQHRKAQKLKDSGYYERMQRLNDRIKRMWTSVVKSKEFIGDLKSESYRYEDLSNMSDIEFEHKEKEIRNSLYKKGIYYRAP